MIWTFRWWRTLGAVALLLGAAIHSQAEHIVLESYQDEQGLTNLNPNCLVQDGRSRLWICTENGLFRFDGFRVRAEPMPKEAGGYLYGARTDSLGRLWTLSEGGVFIRQDGPAGPSWTEVLKPNGKHLHVESSQQLQVDVHGVVYAMDEDSLLWTAATGGVLGASMVVQRIPVPATGSSPDQLPPLRLRGPALWFGCGEQLCEWRDGRLQHWGAAQGLPNDNWGQLLVTRDGGLVARSSGRLARLATGATAFKVVAAPRRRDVYGHDATVEDPKGDILTATDRGISSWDGEHWRGWTRQDGLPEGAVSVLHFDAEGSLWMGANGRGVHRWVGYGQVEHWAGDAGLPSSAVLDLARDGSGRLWAATADGLAWFDASARAFHRARHPALAAGAVHCLAVDVAGDLWWVEAGRLMRVRAGSVEPRVMARDSGLACVSQGARRVYASGNAGLEMLGMSDGRLDRATVGEGKFDPRYDIRVMFDGNPDLFVISGRDLWSYRRDGWARVQDVKGNPIDALQATMLHGALWAGGTDGLGAYALSEAGARQLQFLPKSDFDGATAASLRAGPDGRLWMGTDRGVFIRATDGRWSQLDRRTGLVGNDVTSAFLADADGSVWIGTAAGITHLLPHARPAALPALRLDEAVLGSRAYLSPPTDPVPWADRVLRITLGTAGFSRARSLQIEYRLEADAPWRRASGSVVDIGALDPGSHVLEVRAVGTAPLESPGPVLRIPLDVRAPWWNSPNALAAFAIGLMVFWWLSIRWLRRRDRARQRKLEAAVAERTADLASSEEALRRLGEYNAQSLENERLRVSRELHDELGQQLAALRMEVSVAKVRASSDKPFNPSQLDLLLTRVDQLVRSVRGLVSQLRPPALDGGLQAALEWLAAELTSSTKLACTVHVDPEARQLSSEAATMVFRIAQESLTNVHRHSQAQSVSVSLDRQGEGWVLSVCDDGTGFDPLGRKAGFGILGMKERARLLGGRLDVHSAAGAGTQVVLHIGEAASSGASKP